VEDIHADYHYLNAPNQNNMGGSFPFKDCSMYTVTGKPCRLRVIEKLRLCNELRPACILRQWSVSGSEESSRYKSSTEKSDDQLSLKAQQE
jgi:hypothetical protein